MRRSPRKTLSKSPAARGLPQNLSATPTKSPKRSHLSVSQSPVTRQALQITPPKCARLTPKDQQMTPETPSPSRIIYNLGGLDAALDLYFSPKKRSPKSPKSPGRSPGRGPQRTLNFSQDLTESGDSNDEELAAEKGPKKNVEILSCDLSALKKCFDTIDNFLPLDVQERLTQIEQRFGDWRVYLESGEFNVLLHGLGSKRKVLERFCVQLEDSIYVTVDGFNAEASVQALLEKLNIEFDLRVVHRKLSLGEWAENIREAIEEANHKFYLVVHNIDAPNLRSEKQQEALSILAGSKSVFLIASVDHVNAMLIWNEKMHERFAWLYVPASTLHCYSTELLDGESKLLGLDTKGGSKAHTMDSLERFWQATTQNMRKILEQLVIHAPAPSDKNRPQLSIPKFCKILKDEFATTSETVLRQQLTEFCDHRIAQLDANGTIQLVVDRNLLALFLDAKLADT